MILSSAVQSANQPDYVALAMVLAFAAIVAVMSIRKYTAKKHGQPAPHAEPVEETEKAPAPGSAGQIKLYDVEPKAAAMLMAIVAHKMGKPLNELRFLSIREVSPRSGRQSAQTK